MYEKRSGQTQIVDFTSLLIIHQTSDRLFSVTNNTMSTSVDLGEVEEVEEAIVAY